MYLFWAFQNEIWNEVAMKLRFSRIAEQRKCSISFVTSGNLAGKREAVHFVPNPWDFWRKWNLGSDLQWIPHWTHLCGAFGRLWRKRTWIDWGRSCLRWIVSTGAEICSDKFMFKFVWNIVRIEVGWWWRFAMELEWVHNGVFDENTLSKFMRRLVSYVFICTTAYFDTKLQEIWEDSAREQLDAGWIMTWGQDQGGQNSFDVDLWKISWC